MVVVIFLVVVTVLKLGIGLGKRLEGRFQIRKIEVKRVTDQLKLG